MDKFYVVVERDNPQLGIYLSKVLVGKKRVNKASISCRLPNGSLKFCLNVGSRHGYHYFLGDGRCLYGSNQYLGFDTAAAAKAYLDSNWSGHYNYDRCIKAIEEA